ncbi:hypothetical protein ABZ697_27775 [Streptomyces albidoflavus]|uniref:hypothetical protein n=1 Tax=Streptomyces albidoflavus TaxID=1886 RepID=UPI0033C5774B
MTITEDRPTMTSERRPRLSTRAELAAYHGISSSTMDRLWAARDTNGQPAPVETRPMRWRTAEWDRWYTNLPAGTGTASTTTRTTTPPPPPPGDPQDLIGPSEFARILGVDSHAQISRAAKARPEDRPEHFPAPDDWGDPVARTRPKWRRHRAEEYARLRPALPVARPGRPKGTAKPGGPYAGDPRRALVDQALADHPDLSARALARQLAARHPDTADRTWERIIRAVTATDQELPST